ncbi:MAG: RDD family protein [Micrococcales bacterium]|nr:RDD family protein [Micrococcales bacterium]
MSDRGILTGEAVLLETRPATFVSRLLGGLIDVAVYGAGTTAVMGLIGAIGAASGYGAAIFAILLVVAVLVGAPVTVETLSRGRSVGKLAMGLRIVRDDGGPITVRQALVRALVGIIELWATSGVLAIIASAVHPRGKRLGDMLAGTYCARVRGAQSRQGVVLMPFGLAGWAASADMARLPDGLALAVRQFLGRAAMLHPASRVALGSQLTREVQAYVRPLPPPGVHPEAFLAAVVAERGSRELVAEQARQARAAADWALLGRLPHGIPDPD